MPPSSMSNVTGMGKKRKLSNVVENDGTPADRRLTDFEGVTGLDVLGADSKPQTIDTNQTGETYDQEPLLEGERSLDASKVPETLHERQSPSSR